MNRKKKYFNFSLAPEELPTWSSIDKPAFHAEPTEQSRRVPPLHAIPSFCFSLSFSFTLTKTLGEKRRRTSSVSYGGGSIYEATGMAEREAVLRRSSPAKTMAAPQQSSRHRVPMEIFLLRSSSSGASQIICSSS